MQFRTPGSRWATTALANLAVATLAFTVPLALAEDVGVAGDASLTTLSLQLETSQPTDSTSEPNQRALLQQGLRSIYDELENGKYQDIIAGAASFFGLVVAFRGEFAFQMLLTISCGGVFYILAKANTKLAWQGGATGVVDGQANVVGIEVGLFAAIVTYKSYEGVKLVVGGILGLAIGVMIDGALKAQGFYMHHWLEIIFYSVLAALSVLMFLSGRHRHALCVVMPIIGGSFVVSALLYMIAVRNNRSAWVLFVCPLWVPSGAWEIARHVGQTITISCYAVWAILTIAGAAVQWRNLKKEKRPASKSKSPATVTSAPVSDRKQPLLASS